ncbi:MAG: hypothetical protein GEU90_14320 [Gemmatimonas sp.]|nr:hypothetical protein [Gemmatimonas sp.]
MARTSARSIAAAVLETAGQTFCEELKIPLERGTPSPLFRTLCFSLLSSTRIGHRAALSAARALADAGWTTPPKMNDSTWRQRTDVLNRSGYARYDESTSTMLGDTTAHLLDEYGGDLRRLRDAAERNPQAERGLLKEFKGIGNVGVDIFFREIQFVWDELLPFADRRTLSAARQLKLGNDSDALRKLVDSDRDYVRLAAGLVRVDLEDRYGEIRVA